MSVETSRPSESSPSGSISADPVFVFGGHQGPTPRFQGVSGVDTQTPPRFRPLAAPSAFRRERASNLSFTFGNNSDQPLPSVEKDPPVNDNPRNAPGTDTGAPSTSVDGGPLPDTGGVPASVETADGPAGPSPRGRETPSPQETESPSRRVAPSVQVTPAPQTGERNQSRAEDLTEGLDSLHIHSPSAGEVPDRSQSWQSRSTTPSRRRRSGSAVDKTPHDVEKEDPPQTFSRMREVQQVFTNARNMSGSMVSVLSSSDLHQEAGTSIENLHREALRLRDFELPSTRIVGLVGDSGVGKSSLINSLLDKKDLARASNSGSACTCVATEYHYHEQNDYVIQAEYFTLDELKTQYEELLRAYQDNGAPPADATQNELEDLQRRAHLAQETFKASFGERLEQNPEVLTSQIEHGVEVMLQWASQLLPRDISGHSRETKETYSDIASCSSRIRELTSEVEQVEVDRSERTCPWPFVKKIRVYLKAYILSQGLIIADLPGLRDANTARQNIAERFALHCHQILAVTRIDRAITDQSVKDIFQLARRANLSNVHIVCTKSDEIRVNEAMVSYPSQEATMKAMQRGIESTKQRIDSLTELIEEFDEDVTDRSDEEAREYAELQQDRWNAGKQIEDQEFRLHQHTITVRNADVSRGIRAQYNGHPAATNLRTFCVSNKIYWKHRAKPATASTRFLQLSGIIDLRRYCIGIVAENHLRAIDQYIKHEIPTLLGSIELWINAGSGDSSAETKQEILNTVTAVQAKLHELTSPISPVNDLGRNLRQVSNNQVEQHMEQHSTQWSANARQAASEWRGWHHSTYSAFCRNRGEHCTEAAGYHCWNEEATTTMADDLSSLWGAFTTQLNNRISAVEAFVGQTFDDVASLAFSAARAGNQTHAALITLTATIRHRRDLLLYSIDNTIENFRNGILILRTDAVSSLRTAFIGQLMEETYRAATMEYGRGSDLRRKDLITRRFSSDFLFIRHKRLFKDALRDLTTKTERAIKEGVAQQVALIEADLELLRDEHVVLESEKNPQFRLNLAQQVERTRTALRGLSSALDADGTDEVDISSILGLAGLAI